MLATRPKFQRISDNQTYGRSVFLKFSFLTGFPIPALFQSRQDGSVLPITDYARFSYTLRFPNHY